MAASTDLRIDPITSADDFPEAHQVVTNAFAKQAGDEIWTHFNPGWDTPAGQAAAAARMAARFSKTTRDAAGDPNTVFLKATLPDADRGAGARRIVGVAIWVQLSMVEGRGDRPVEDLRAAADLEALYPGDARAQRYCVEVERGLHRRRAEVVRAKAGEAQPAVMVLDLCAVEIGFQRRGIAQKLVRWGLEEAARRGGLEALTEASAMGRGAYVKLSFRQEGPEIDYGVSEEFKDWKKPSNIFMRTGLEGLE
ncbi:hypothetical protein BN1708_012409, partial [Verticillium longisporum]